MLWQPMLKLGIRINFAHRTFRWSNEGRGIAAVHCVIVGFSLTDSKKKVIYDYADISGEPDGINAKNINPYLVDAPFVLIGKRRTPLCPDAPDMVFGNMPNDGGYLLLSQDEADAIMQNDPIAAKYLSEFLGADEFINNLPRYCLWLVDSTEQGRENSPELKARIDKVKVARLSSAREATKKLANAPHLFGEVRQTDQPYLLVPSVSSENRRYVPIGYFDANVIASNLVFMLPNASLYHFGILTSTMHNAWMRAVCGRLESRYQYSALIVYNNFPWPDSSEELQESISEKAQAILDARAVHEGKSLAWRLYNPETMPENLSNAHTQLDKAVDAAYGYKEKKDDAERVAFLFKLYQALTTGLPSSAATQTESTATITVIKAPKKPTGKPKNV